MGRNPGACKVGAKGTKRVLIKQDADGKRSLEFETGSLEFEAIVTLTRGLVRVKVCLDWVQWRGEKNGREKI